jgi:hypothetical protein
MSLGFEPAIVLPKNRVLLRLELIHATGFILHVNFVRGTQSGEPWETAELRELKSLAKQNTPTGVISVKLRRPPAATRSKAQREGVPLRPTNRSPHSRREVS